MNSADSILTHQSVKDLEKQIEDRYNLELSNSNSSSLILSQVVEAKTLNLISSSKISNNKIKELEEENKNLKKQVTLISSILYKCVKYISKLKKEMESLQKTKPSNINDLNLTLTHKISQSSMDESLNIHYTHSNIDNHLTNNNFQALDRLSLKKMKSSKISQKLNLPGFKHKDRKNNINIKQIQIEENREKMKKKFFNASFIKKFKEKNKIPKDISDNDVKQAFVDYKFNIDEAVKFLKSKDAI